MRPTGPLVRFGALVALLLTLAAVLATAGLPRPADLAALLAETAVPTPLLAVVGSAVLVAGLVPRTLLAAALGLVFGPLAGAGYIIAGATVAALVAFGVGRWLGREFVAVQARVSRLDGWLSRRGLLGVLTVRVLPLAPFGLMSYAFGTTGVRLPAYLAGTVLGMIPGTVVYVNLGAHAHRPASPAFWISAGAAVLLYLTTAGTVAWLSRRHARPSQNAGGRTAS